MKDSILDSTLDSLERAHGLEGVTDYDPANRQSFGLLVLDLLTRGGMKPGGWFTFFGGEQSSKSTLAMSSMGTAAADDAIPIQVYMDYEGSLDLEYFTYMMQINRPKLNVVDVFGQRGSKGWLVRPRVRQYQESVAEKFFEWFHDLLLWLPDKRKLDGQWWKVYDDTKEAKSLVGDSFDKALSKERGGLWVPTDNGKAQALIVVDSYPAMLPRSMDITGKEAGLAAQARMFSEQIKKVKGRMSPKRVTLMGVNQLRKNPGVMYGPSETEPGGEALKFYCFSADTLLVTDEGFALADEAAKRMQASPSRLHGETGYETPSVYTDMGRADLLQATLVSGAFVKGKPNHRVRTLSVTADGFPELGWKTLSKLQAGDIVVQAMPCVYPPNTRKEDGLASYDQAQRLAELIEDGSWQEKESPEFQSLLTRLRFSDRSTFLHFLYHLADEGQMKFYCHTRELAQTLQVMISALRVSANVYEHENEYLVTPATQAGHMRLRDYIYQGVAPRIEDTATQQSLDFALQRLLGKDYLSRVSADASASGELQPSALKQRIGQTDVPPTDAELALSILTIRNYATNNNLTFSSVVEVRPCGTQQTYDCAMPSRSILTSAIVSHNSDVRIRMSSRVMKGVEYKNGVEEEASISGEGVDTYRYVAMKTIKNKLGGIPNSECWARVWVADAEGKARGYDPVFDCFAFLKMIGAVSGTKNRLKINLPEFNNGEHKVISWHQFKTLVLGNKQQVTDVCTDIGIKPFRLRHALQKKINDGSAYDAWITASKGSSSSGDE